jgi:protein SEY1
MQVNLKLFQTAPGKSKTVLLLVIRDRTRTPFEKMVADMRRDLDSIWGALVKPPEYAAAPLDDFFELQYVSLPSYEREADDFVAEATLLRRRFLPSYNGDLLREDESKVVLLPRWPWFPAM